MPSRGSFDIMAVHSTTVSPVPIRTAPLACSATVPVVIRISRPATSRVFVTSATYQYTSTREAWDLKAELEAEPQGQVLGAGPPETNSGGMSRQARHASPLPPDAELRDQCAIAPNVAAAQVVQQSATLADEQQQTATRVMVLLMSLQVLCELRDSLSEDCYLDLGRTRVGFVEAILPRQLCLDFAFDCQTGRDYTHRTAAPPFRRHRLPGRAGAPQPGAAHEEVDRQLVPRGAPRSRDAGSSALAPGSESAPGRPGSEPPGASSRAPRP